MKKFDQLKDWIHKYGVVNVINRSFHTLSPIQIVANRTGIRRVNWQAKCKKKLKKYLVYYEPHEDITEKTETRIIWWMWLQGSAQAPPLVRRCLQSVKDFADKSGFELIELNEKNLREYVELPEHIWNKWEKGQIIPAHFSDLCRINLMANRGGLWIDSTVLLTGAIDQVILDSDIFFYRASFLDVSETKISNWFLYSKTMENPFYMSLYKSLIMFWESGQRPNDYFIFHLFAALLIESGKFKNTLDEMPYYTNTYPTLLQHELNKPFQKEKYRSIIEKTSVHKLTYKGLNEKAEDTFLAYILKNGI